MQKNEEIIELLKMLFDVPYSSFPDELKIGKGIGYHGCFNLKKEIDFSQFTKRHNWYSYERGPVYTDSYFICLDEIILELYLIGKLGKISIEEPDTSSGAFSCYIEAGPRLGEEKEYTGATRLLCLYSAFKDFV